jgi:signal transduction histidine kinase
MPGSQKNGSSERSKAGVGIQGMRERVRQLGGHFDIQSNEKGTTVTAKCPATAYPISISSLDPAGDVQGFPPPCRLKL